jgi:NitT/TauT family transport system substrate-binding protein
VRFGRAYTKGVLACEANPAACSKAFWKHYPSRKPSIYPDDEKNLEFTIRLLGGALRSYLDFAPGTPRKHGSYDPKTWRDFIDVLHAGGQLKTKAIDHERLYTNAMVDGINNFDPAAVAAAAKAVR